MNEFVVMLLAGVLSSNVISGTGYAAISLQSEKRSFVFMLVSAFATICSAIIAGLAYSALKIYALDAFDISFLSLFAMMIIVVIVAYISRLIIKLASAEQYYLYEKSYQFAIECAVIISILLLINYNNSFLNVMFQLAMFCLGFLLVQVLFYPLYERLDNKRAFKAARNIPLMLYALAVLAMIAASIQMLI